MGRKSKLSEQQWADLFRRVMNGESRRALGEEYGISEASIRQREAKTGKTQEVQKVARMIVETDAALKSLPIDAQINAQNLAVRLRSISESLAAGAELGARNYHRLSALANAELQKVDDADPGASEVSLRTAAAMTKMGNECAATPINLLAANRDRVPKAGEGEEEDPDKPRGVLVVPGMLADTQAWSSAAQASSLKSGGE